MGLGGWGGQRSAMVTLVGVWLYRHKGILPSPGSNGVFSAFDSNSLCARQILRLSTASSAQKREQVACTVRESSPSMQEQIPLSSC